MRLAVNRRIMLLANFLSETNFQLIFNKLIYHLYSTRLEAPFRVPLPSLLKIQLSCISLDITSIEYVTFKTTTFHYTKMKETSTTFPEPSLNFPLTLFQLEDRHFYSCSFAAKNYLARASHFGTFFSFRGGGGRMEGVLKMS